MKLKSAIQNKSCHRDECFIDRNITKLAKAIWKYCFKYSVEPKYSKQDAMTIAMAIFWNDADACKEVLSYTDKFGNRVYMHEDTKKEEGN